MTSQPSQQTIVIHMLPNISRSKGNQTMKFGQLIECNMSNIFLEKSYTKWDGETSTRPFSEKLKLSISLDQQSKVLCSLFLLYAKLRHLETKLQTTFFYLIISFLKKSIEVWDQSPCFIFCITFQEKYFSCYILLTGQISFSGCLYFVKYWAVCVS